MEVLGRELDGPLPGAGNPEYVVRSGCKLAGQPRATSQRFKDQRMGGAVVEVFGDARPESVGLRVGTANDHTLRPDGDVDRVARRRVASDTPGAEKDAVRLDERSIAVSFPHDAGEDVDRTEQKRDPPACRRPKDGSPLAQLEDPSTIEHDQVVGQEVCFAQVVCHEEDGQVLLDCEPPEDGTQAEAK